MDDVTPDSPRSTRNVALKGRSIRQHAARGTVVNGVFLVGLSVVGLIKGFLLAGFLTRDDYGVWGVLIAGLGTLVWLKQVGIGDKYIQQEEADQEVAFQKAFTLEAIFTMGMCVLLIAALPVVAVVYGRWQIIAPGLVMILTLPAGVFQAPLWVYYREMNFVKQRTLQAAEPIVGLVVAVVLAVAGAGYWALVLSVFAGAWTTSAIAVRSSPYKLKWRYEKGVVRSYVQFSLPLLGSVMASLLLTQGAILLPNRELGLAAAGAIALASTVTQFTDRVDQIVTGTLYPAICAAQDKLDVLAESFVKSNRIGLMWAMPFGFAVSMFGGDLVHFALGTGRWQEAIGPLQILGITAALGHIGFNWDAYFRATGNTGPIATASVISVVAFFAAAVPLIKSNGLVGLSLGVTAHVVALVACRAYYIARMFRGNGGFGVIAHSTRAMLPTLIATGALVLVRMAESGPRTAWMAGTELVGFWLLTIIVTIGLERPLLREAAGYMRARPAPAATAAPAV